MLNQAILVGRVKELLENAITIAIPRSYKNEDGEYDTDFIQVHLTSPRIQESAAEYLHVGDIIGVKGSLSTNDGNVWVNAEKITFLSSRQNNDEEEEEE